MSLTPKKAGAKPLPTEEGKYIEVLKRQDDGSWKIGSSHVTLNGSTLEFYMLGGSNWSVSADLTSLHGVAVIPVN